MVGHNSQRRAGNLAFAGKAGLSCHPSCGSFFKAAGQKKDDAVGVNWRLAREEVLGSIQLGDQDENTLIDEGCPQLLRPGASGMGFSYGIGNLGKIIGPLGLALIVGCLITLARKVTLDALFPALLFLAFLKACTASTT